MKKKIINIIFCVPILLIGITFLAIQEYIIGLALLLIACITFYYIGTSNSININSRIKNTIIAYIFIFILYSIIIFIISSIEEKKEKMNYENDINMCYNILNEEHNYTKFENLIDKNNYTFKNEAYSVLENLIDEKIEKAKLGTTDNEFVSMLKQASIKNYDIEKKVKLLNGYNELAKADENIKNEDYIGADNILTVLIFDTDIQEIKDNAKSKQEQIKEQLGNQVISKAQELVNKKDYKSAISLLSNYKNLKNDSINTMYSNVSNEISKEEQAKIETERFNYEVYCYFNLIAWNEKDTITDDIAYSKCAKKFGITKEQAKEIYNNIKYVGYSYQSKYPDIFEKYASQYK